MRYHSRTIVGAALLVVTAAIPVTAQTPSGPGVFGFYDVASGTFRAVTLQTMPAASTGEVEPQAQVSRTGRIRFRIKINVKNGSPAAVLPSCSVSASHTGVLHSYNESIGDTGTRTNNNAECILEISYFWPKANNANPVNLSFFASISSPSRSHSQTLPSIPLPASGDLTAVVVTINL